MVSPTKKSENLVKLAHKTNVVGPHRLADGRHSAVFPQHASPNPGSFHSGPRNGHGGSHTSPSRKSK
jgi:hypothetical protein